MDPVTPTPEPRHKVIATYAVTITVRERKAPPPELEGEVDTVPTNDELEEMIARALWTGTDLSAPQIHVASQRTDI